VLLPLLVAATLSVAATSTDLRDLVAAVGGDRVSVESLTDPRQDPHALEILPGQLVRLREARLLVRVGLDHEPWLGRALVGLRERPRDLDLSRAVILLGTETPRLRAERGAHVHAFGNTHYWLDPANALPITARIAEALADLAPADRATFDANRARFVARLEADLARWEGALRPFAGTRVVTAHDTWPYFARRFGLTIAATVEEKPGVPPSAAYVAGLVARMRAAGVRVVIGEPSANAALLRRIAEQTGARVVTLAPSVGADAEATDYLTLFDVNVRRLAAALAP
jgi:ABC-type Zn uptake system ZnuABC Zn-binding protein ZnuA